MLSKVLQPYQDDADAWDWKLIAILGAFGRAHPDTFVMLFILVVLASIAFVILWCIQHIATYIWQLNGSLERTMPRNARILQGTLMLFVALVIGSTQLYKHDHIEWVAYSNIVGFSFFLFAVAITVMELQVRRAGISQPAPPVVKPGQSLDIKKLLRWNRKQVSNKP